MKALIVCSVHALCDISALERTACNRACAEHGIPAILTDRDHARILTEMTMLELLGRLPGSDAQRDALIETYLDILNEDIWTASLAGHQSVFNTLLEPVAFKRPTAFVSDYPILTTNLVRSAALLTAASRLGHVSAPAGRAEVPDVAAGLTASAAALGVAHGDVAVLVAHRRDFLAARSVGMRPRYVAEVPLAEQQEPAAAREVAAITEMHAIGVPIGVQAVAA